MKDHFLDGHVAEALKEEIDTKWRPALDNVNDAMKTIWNLLRTVKGQHTGDQDAIDRVLVLAKESVREAHNLLETEGGDD